MYIRYKSEHCSNAAVVADCSTAYMNGCTNQDAAFNAINYDTVDMCINAGLSANNQAMDERDECLGPLSVKFPDIYMIV